jgi:lipoprotein signal peptidase
MITARPPQEKTYQKYAWVILLALGILLVVNILIVAGVEDHALEFEKDTGVAWHVFTATYPGVAASYIQEQHLLYIGFASLALFALVITYFGFRQGDRWAWFAMWLLPFTLTLAALLLSQSRRPLIGAFYGVFAIVAVIGLVLPIRKFFPKQS